MIVQIRSDLDPGLIPQSLTKEKQYVVLEIGADDFRVLDDDDDPVLFAPELFAVIDPTEPADWIDEYGDDGERYAQPQELDRVSRYIWEEYHDGVPEAVAAVKAYLRRIGPCSWRAGASPRNKNSPPEEEEM